MRFNDNAKQLPLLFVIMSGKSKKDYRAILKEIKKILLSVAGDDDELQVKHTILNFYMN